jgi:hypothetical protein
MHRMRSLFLPAVLPLIAIVNVGCQSSTLPASPAVTSPQRAIFVSGGNGGSTVVFLPSNDAANPVMLCESGATVCPECKAAAIKYFTAGVLDPKCSRTGATRAVLTGAPPNYGHN